MSAAGILPLLLASRSPRARRGRVALGCPACLCGFACGLGGGILVRGLFF